jgi:hypothetical protein
VVHPVGHDELFCEGQSPGLHGMRLAKVVRFHSRIGVPRDSVSLRTRDAIRLSLEGDFLINAQGGIRGGRRIVFLDDGGARHDVGTVGKYWEEKEKR